MIYPKFFRALCLLFFSSCTHQVIANNVQISNVTYDEDNNTLNFDVSWENGFYISSDWSDHVYIFVKYKNSNGSSWERVLFEPSGHSDDSASMLFGVASNSPLIDGKRLGMRAYHSSLFASGTESANCTAQLSNDIDFFHPSFKVFAIEMVTISSVGNDYYLGDGVSLNRWHKGDDTTQAFFWEQSFVSATVGNGPDDINTTHPDGIPVATVNSNILRAPNNIMKYEITQQQYVEFLNCLNRTAQNNRVAADVSGTTVDNPYVMTNTSTVAGFTRNGVRCDATLPNGGPVTFYCDLNGNGVPNENDDGQNIAVNYISGQDLFAYLDWAGLSPLNELQYEHVCRGSYNAVPNEFAWGTSGFETAVVNIAASTAGTPEEVLSNAPAIGPLKTSQFPMRVGAPATSTTNRITSGSSAFGIMELSGNVAELVIALRNSSAFGLTTVGDGTINSDGTHDENWPSFVVEKGGYITGDAQTVSHRPENSLPYMARSAFYGGRGGY
ncbi:MAG: hypothetical protein AAGA77_08885 [Bacteroidota bacterium]